MPFLLPTFTQSEDEIPKAIRASNITGTRFVLGKQIHVSIFKVIFSTFRHVGKASFQCVFYLKAYRQESTAPGGSAICHLSVNDKEQKCKGATNQSKGGKRHPQKWVCGSYPRTGDFLSTNI